MKIGYVIIISLELLSEIIILPELFIFIGSDQFLLQAFLLPKSKNIINLKAFYFFLGRTILSNFFFFY